MNDSLHKKISIIELIGQTRGRRGKRSQPGLLRVHGDTCSKYVHMGRRYSRQSLDAIYDGVSKNR